MKKLFIKFCDLFKIKKAVPEQKKQNVPLKKGEHIFEMNLDTLRVKIAKMEPIEGSKAKRLVERERHIYLQAKNKIEAVNKFKKVIKKALSN